MWIARAWRTLRDFLASGPAPEGLPEKVARSLSQEGAKAPTCLHLAPFNLPERQQLFKHLPDDHRPSHPGVERIEFNKPLAEMRSLFLEWFSEPATNITATGEVVGVAPTVGGENIQQTAPTPLQSSQTSPGRTAETVEAPMTEPRTEQRVIQPPPVRSVKKASFFSRLFKTEETVVHTSRMGKQAALALAGASAAIFLGALFSTRETENELRELQQSKNQENSWTAKLRTAQQQLERNITNL